MFVARCWGSHFDHDVGREIRTECWVTREGHISRNQRMAMLYASEADAWAHLVAANLLDSDERGEWCRVEEVASR